MISNGGIKRNSAKNPVDVSLFPALAKRYVHKQDECADGMSYFQLQLKNLLKNPCPIGMGVESYEFAYHNYVLF